MPTPSPTIVATIGANGLTDITPHEHVMPAAPTASPATATSDREAGRDDRAEHQQQDDQRGDDADELAGALHRAAGGARQLAAERDLQAGRLGRRDRLLERLGVTP